MGVHGLWRLIEPSGKTVPLETLENKVLAVDISIWLHQAIKGFQDSRGAPLPNAHLLGIYHRVCKLLYFKIKPVFVFDGGVPILKKQTIAKRNHLKSRNQTEANKLQKQLLNTLLKHSAVSNVLSEQAKANITQTKVSPVKSKGDDKHDLFALPSTSMDSTISSSDDEIFDTSVTTEEEEVPSSQLNIHNIDTASKEFKSLPADVRYEILSEVKDTRKQSSWGRLHEIPTQSDDFSTYQMDRLLQRQNVQNELEKTEQEMGGHSLSLAELESLMKDQGVITKSETVGKRIASDENTRFLFIKDVKQAIQEAEQKYLQQETINEVTESDEKSKPIDKEKLKVLLKKKCDFSPESEDLSKDEFPRNKEKSIADLEYEEDLERAIQLSLECDSENTKRELRESDKQLVSSEDEEIFDSTYIEEANEDILKKLSSAQSYMLEYSGLTPNEIARILKQNCDKGKYKRDRINKNLSNKLATDDLSLVKQKNEITESTASLASQRLHKAREIEVDSNSVINDFKEHLSMLKEDKYVEKEQGNINTTDTEKTISSSNSGHLSNTNELSNRIVHKNKCIREVTSMEIVINPNDVVEDDIFRDIFEDINTQSEQICEKSSNENTIACANKYVVENVQEIQIMSSDSDESGNEFVQVVSSIKSNHNIEPKQSALHDLTPNFASKKITEVDALRSSQSDSATSGTADVCGSSSEKINHKDIDIPKQDHEMIIINSDSNLLETDENTRKGTKESKLQPKKLKANITSEVTEHDASSSNLSMKNNLLICDELQTDQPKLSVEQLQELQEDLRKEQTKLQSEKSLKERLAGNISDQMYQEAQELLELFGVPYIIAPMEAEAQCAFLDAASLTDGSITDDSDIWLFGGKTVYKNFFNQSKQVLEFRAENILHHFKLTRQQMILLALLVGSDYTTGIEGVGPVTALEILAAFPYASETEFSLTHNQLLSGLAEFRNWLNKGKATGLGRKGLRSKLKNIKFSENFPSIQVVEAYLEPTVDSSREPFSWSKPDIFGLIDFARQKFGWTITKSEEILNPVVKRLQEKHTQKSIKEYFKTNTRIMSNVPEDKMSKRVKSAVKRIGNEPVEDESKPKQKKSRKKKIEVTATSSDVEIGKNKANPSTSEPSDFVMGITEKQIETKQTTKKAETSATKENESRQRGRKKKNAQSADIAEDEDVIILQSTAARSSKRVQEINNEIKNTIAEAEIKKAKAPNLHIKERIHQRERDKAMSMRNKLKAIEIFRKSQQGPGYVKKRVKTNRAIKADAELSEDSSD